MSYSDGLSSFKTPKPEATTTLDKVSADLKGAGDLTLGQVADLLKEREAIQTARRDGERQLAGALRQRDDSVASLEIARVTFDQALEVLTISADVYRAKMRAAGEALVGLDAEGCNPTEPAEDTADRRRQLDITRRVFGAALSALEAALFEIQVLGRASGMGAR